MHFWTRVEEVLTGTFPPHPSTGLTIYFEANTHSDWHAENTYWRHFRWSAFVVFMKNAVNVEIKLHLECKLCFPRAQFRLRRTYKQVSRLTTPVSRPSLDVRRRWRRDWVNCAEGVVLCGSGTDSKSSWLPSRKDSSAVLSQSAFSFASQSDQTHFGSYRFHGYAAK